MAEWKQRFFLHSSLTSEGRDVWPSDLTSSRLPDGADLNAKSGKLKGPRLHEHLVAIKWVTDSWKRMETLASLQHKFSIIVDLRQLREMNWNDLIVCACSLVRVPSKPSHWRKFQNPNPNDLTWKLSNILLSCLDSRYLGRMATCQQSWLEQPWRARPMCLYLGPEILLKDVIIIEWHNLQNISNHLTLSGDHRAEENFPEIEYFSALYLVLISRCFTILWYILLFEPHEYESERRSLC